MAAESESRLMGVLVRPWELRAPCGVSPPPPPHFPPPVEQRFSEEGLYSTGPAGPQPWLSQLWAPGGEDSQGGARKMEQRPHSPLLCWRRGQCTSFPESVLNLASGFLASSVWV